jgi:lambda family phage portal protein
MTMSRAIEAAPRERIFSAVAAALGAAAAQTSSLGGGRRPALLGPDGLPLLPRAPAISPDSWQYRRTAAQLKGSLKTWKPYQLGTESQVSQERERIIERAIDLVQSDPHAAGIVENYATLVVGKGLRPYPQLDPIATGLSRDQIKIVSAQQKAVYRKWSQYAADAGGRMSFESIEFLAMRQLVQFGEFIFTVPMVERPGRPYYLGLQPIHPLRLKTPVDLLKQENIREGVEIGDYGEATHYWIKRTGTGAGYKADVSSNFIRIPARVGHRLKVIHCFYQTDSEQFRGYSFFSPAMKFLRDLSDYLDAELVSNIVTAAMAVFIESAAADPYKLAENQATITDTGYKSDGSTYDQRYQEIEPGAILYGSSGEKPHLLAAQRPGATFGIFLKEIEKSISLGLNMPQPVLFKDFGGMNYASYRSAMLEAWRIVTTKRQWMAGALCAPCWLMLQEEAYLRGELAVKDFYSKMYDLCACDWIGHPKGQIETLKEVQAEIAQIQHNLKSREESMLEQGRDWSTTFDQIEEEQQVMEEKGLNEMPVVDAPDDPGDDDEN